MAKLDRCKWIFNEGMPDEGWTTDCGREHRFENEEDDLLPVDRSFEFCPYCGGTIVGKRVEPQEPEIF